MNDRIQSTVQAGGSVWDLRKIGASPAQIRAAGFTLSQMRAYLGVHLLNDAGFTLQDYIEEGIPLSDLYKHITVQDLVDCGVFSLSQLMEHFPVDVLRRTGRFSVRDFAALSNTSATLLKQYGFNEEEIASCTSLLRLATQPRTPNELQPALAQSMSVGDRWHARRDGDASTFLEVTYSRVSPEEALQLLSNPHPENGQCSRYPYDGSGRTCPRCGQLFILLSKRQSSDGMCGVEQGKWVCDDPQCGVVKEERYEGYRSIF